MCSTNIQNCGNKIKFAVVVKAVLQAREVWRRNMILEDLSRIKIWHSNCGNELIAKHFIRYHNNAHIRFEYLMKNYSNNNLQKALFHLAQRKFNKSSFPATTFSYSCVLR